MPEGRVSDPGPDEHHPVVVIGAGQAGLSASWHLTEADVDHVVLERDTIGHDWIDRRWQNFTLVTPNWQCRLPGYSYQGEDPEGFMWRDEVYAFVRDYADAFGAPVREHTLVAGVDQTDEGFLVRTTGSDGVERRISTGAVIVAVGGYHRPRVPRLSERIPDHVRQLHSSAYRRVEDLADGAVVVVGCGQSGAQIAEDLHREGRAVHLLTGSAPRVARFYRGRDCVAWLQDMGNYDVAVESTPGGLAAREKTNHYVTGRDGGHDIDLRQFAREGMALYGRMVGVDLVDHDRAVIMVAPDLEANLDHADAVSESIKDGIDRYIAERGIEAPIEPRYRPVWRPEVEPTRLDLQEEGVSTIIWATGFSADFRWLRVPAFDGEGLPCHRRGVSTVPGLYFLGLPWLHTWGSGRFAGVARDAEYVVDRLTSERLRRELPVAS